MNYVYF